MEQILVQDLRSRYYNRNLLFTIADGKWRVGKSIYSKDGDDSLTGTLLDYESKKDFYSWKEIMNMPKLPNMTDRNYLWGILNVEEDTRISQTGPSLREMGVENNYVYYGMHLGSDIGGVFFAVNENELLLVCGDTIYPVSREENGHSYYPRMDDWINNWAYRWGSEFETLFNKYGKDSEVFVQEEDEPEELDLNAAPKYNQVFYGTWQITQVLGRGSKPVEGESDPEDPNDIIGEKVLFDLESDLEYECGVIPDVIFHIWVDNGPQVWKQNFFGNAGGNKTLGLIKYNYFTYLKYWMKDPIEQEKNRFYSFAVKDMDEMIFLTKSGWLYQAKRIEGEPEWEQYSNKLNIEENLKTDLLLHANNHFYRNMVFHGDWSITEVIYQPKENKTAQNRIGQGIRYTGDENQIGGYWGLMPVKEDTRLHPHLKTLREMGVEVPFAYYAYINNPEMNGVFLVIEDRKMLYIEGNVVYLLKSNNAGYRAYSRDETVV